MSGKYLSLETQSRMRLIAVIRYQGNMNREQRDKAVRAFMTNKKARVMLMSLKCGGVGLVRKVLSFDCLLLIIAFAAEPHSRKQ